jgi:hypothetical protein
LDPGILLRLLLVVYQKLSGGTFTILLGEAITESVQVHCVLRCDIVTRYLSGDMLMLFWGEGISHDVTAAVHFRVLAEGHGGVLLFGGM